MESYVALHVAPGVHRLCSATRLMAGTKPVLWLGELDAAAGETYFVDTTTLEPVEHNLATVWLRRIAAMPKSDTPDAKALAKWSRTNFPYSQEELRACGIPAVGTNAVPSGSAGPTEDSSGSSQVFAT